MSVPLAGLAAGASSLRTIRTTSNPMTMESAYVISSMEKSVRCLLSYVKAMDQ